MADRFTASRPMPRQSIWQTAGRLTSAALISVSLWAGAAIADPFRPDKPKAIGDQTEVAFRAIFEQGNYSATTRQKLNEAEKAEPTEPLVHALQASMVFSDLQGEKDKAKKADLLERFRAYGTQTRSASQALMESDPLRGNLYTAVSHFLEGGYTVLKDGIAKGASTALSEMQSAFKAMDTAATIDPNDPELNLLKGYMDLMIAVNLPFASPNQAITRLEKYAGPRYLADRGIAIGYRDLKQPDKALVAVERALQATPNNPEVLMLKAQILLRQGKYQESKALFEQALQKKDQLPREIVRQIKSGIKDVNKKLGASQKQ